MSQPDKDLEYSPLYVLGRKVADEGDQDFDCDDNHLGPGNHWLDRDVLITHAP